jgi:transketolase N-terminal domain/subunit
MGLALSPSNRMDNKTAPIYVVVSDGSVQEIKNIPEGATVKVIDKDVEFVAPERWEISPVDGEVCTITTFEAYEPA